ncbi:MAG: hypothetical protein QHH07_09300 [Sedimentisphaerales bacterium]|nr:hypothetical protein [Sedimentisphaerales bacterium]
MHQVGLVLLILVANTASPEQFFGIRVVDDRTGRGVPLVQLQTVNHLSFFTDSAGWVAILEPGWEGKQVYFFVSSDGHEYPKDGFGLPGTTVTVRHGTRLTLKIARINIAERLYRITGEGLYRDSLLLGEPCPIRSPLGSGGVAGQDSAFALPYDNRIFWFWGDTTGMHYPLGHFWMAAATSQPPWLGGLDPSKGIDLEYLTDQAGFSRPVCRLDVTSGMIWADAFATVLDRQGHQRLVCHYRHVQSLDKVLGHGLAIFNDQTQQFDKIRDLDINDLWLYPPQAHPVRYKVDQTQYLMLGEVFPTIRFKADLDTFCDPCKYESWTCLVQGQKNGPYQVLRDPNGNLLWRWASDTRPVDISLERELINQGLIRPNEARFQCVDVDTGQPVVLHRGSVAWNPFRTRWICIAVQQAGRSYLGEVWYLESRWPTGPWVRAKRIVTHRQYCFYNPVHHPFLDQAGGRIIYFEGTYSHTFSGNCSPTPRYDYNQIMYRLDLADPNLAAAYAP